MGSSVLAYENDKRRPMTAALVLVLSVRPCTALAGNFRVNRFRRLTTGCPRTDKTVPQSATTGYNWPFSVFENYPVFTPLIEVYRRRILNAETWCSRVRFPHRPLDILAVILAFISACIH
jgi:hypothetical protein